MDKGKLLIISGFSGVGKGALVNKILDTYSDYVMSVSATTRSPRNGEIDGVHYHFLTMDHFREMIEKDELLEYAEYVGNYYGTPERFVDENLEKGVNVILEIEVQGAAKIKQRRPDTLMIYVLPPDGRTWENRLRGRKTETPEEIRNRMNRALDETKYMSNYDYFVLNDSLEECASNIDKIVKDNCPSLLDGDKVEQIKQEIMNYTKGE